MRRFGFLAGALASLIAANVAQAAPNPPAWRMTGDELRFVPEGSDAFALAFACAKDGSITVTAPVARDAKQAEIVLSAGALTHRFPVRLKQGEGGAFGATSIDRRDVVLGEFLKSGRVRLGGADLNAREPAERQAIARFVRFCWLPQT